MEGSLTSRGGVTFFLPRSRLTLFFRQQETSAASETCSNDRNRCFVVDEKLRTLDSFFFFFF